MCKKLIVLTLSLCLISSAGAATISWNFENGNDHGFDLRSLVPATPAPDDPSIAGDESLTGAGGDNGLPDAGLAWTIGEPNQFDELIPAFEEGCHVVDGVLQYGPCNDPFSAAVGDPPYDFTNGRGQSGYLGTYALSQWGDGLHTAENDQIATSPTVLLDEGAVLTVWAFGNTTASWAGGRAAPELDPNEGGGYVSNTGGIAVLSAEDGSLLDSLLVAAEGGDGNMPGEFSLDLSAYAGQKVIIEVVDAFAGGWGWLVVDEIQITNAMQTDVIWDFENGNDHRFDLWSVVSAVEWFDDPNIAGDESITGAGGHTGLPGAGVAWTVGPPNQFDGLIPVVEEGCHVVDGVLQYGPCNDPFGAAVGDPPYDSTNSRGQSSYLNTYNLSQWGDGLHTADNDQIATSPPVVLGENAVLTVWSHGGGSGTHAPEYDPDPAMMYTDSSSGIAVLSAEEEDKWALLASLYLNGKGTLTEDTLDLSAFAGKQVFIDVVDAFEGGWGWLAVDEIQITNASQLPLVGFVVQTTDGVLDWGFDQAQVDHLKTLGYDVQVIDMVELADGTFTRADANALDLLIISESIGSSSADPLIGTSAPVMHEEAYGWDNWAFMGPADNIHWLAEQTEVEVVNDTHPIMVDASFPVGMLPWFTAPDQYTTENISNMAPGAELLCKAATAAEDSAVVFTVEKGAELANGELAPNRRVGFSIPGNQDGLNQVDGIIDASIMADEQWALYDAAIRWLDQ